MYLSRITVPRLPGWDAYQLHQHVWRWFDPDRQGGQDREFLFRQEGSVVLTLSAQPPVVPAGCQAQTKAFNPPLQPGQMVSFKGRVNATAKISGKRRGLAPENMVDWLRQQLDQIGADLQKVATEDRETVFRKPREGDNVTLDLTEVSGTCLIRDPVQFLAGLQAGIGRGRSFGCGLLLIRPVRA